MKKKQIESGPLPEPEEIDEELDLILRKKKIQNKVLKELIDQLQKHPVSGVDDKSSE
jgi:molybdate-binding protein